MDNRWLERCREGDEQAIEHLVQTYQKEVYRLALSILDNDEDADDATQDAFIAALRALDAYREDASIKTWLFSIAINICRSRLQRAKSRGRLQQVMENLFHIRRDDSPPETAAMQNETNAELWRAVNALDDKHRIPVILRYYHDLSVADIAQSLDIPVGTAHSRLNHARERLRVTLKEEKR